MIKKEMIAMLLAGGQGKPPWRSDKESSQAGGYLWEVPVSLIFR